MAEVTVTRPAGERLSIGEVADRYRADLERRGREAHDPHGRGAGRPGPPGPVLRGSVDGVDPARGRGGSDGQAGGGRARPEDDPQLHRHPLGPVQLRPGAAATMGSSNPCEGLELPGRISRKRSGSSTWRRSTRWWPRCPQGAWQQSDRAMFLAAAMSGLRQGELLALRWRDVDWPAGRIRVRQNYVRGEFGTPKSRRSTRSVPMADRVAGELDRLYKARYGDQETGDHDDELVFPSVETDGAPAALQPARPATGGAQGGEAGRRADLPRSAPHASARGWPRPACRCGRSRSGWATATSPPPRSTPTTRPNPHEAELVEAAFAPRGANRGANLREPQRT